MKVIEIIESKANISKYFCKDIRCKKCGGVLSVSDKKQSYWCEKCGDDGSFGNVFTCLMENENKKFRQAVEYLAEKENVELKECIYAENEYSVEKCDKCCVKIQYGD